MADFTALKTAIQTYIKQNGNEEITGEILQEILLSVVTTLGDGAINDLITALGNEVTARQQADGTLQQNITNEATARGNADTALSNRLGSTITAENTAAEQIGAEAEAREAADTALQGLIDGITDNIENGYVYAGIATPSSTPTTGKVFYLALTAGTYTNFGSTVVSQGINILKYNGSVWSLDAFIGIDDTPTPNSPKLVKSGGAFDSVMTNGSAFDISAHFASGGTLATYADLSAALTALNTLSASYKRGGMSVKFVQSSDNKYVQYRLMSDTFKTAEANWQGVDTVATLNSKNLLESSFTYIYKNSASQRNSKIEKVLFKNKITNYTLSSGGYQIINGVLEYFESDNWKHVVLPIGNITRVKTYAGTDVGKSDVPAIIYLNTSSPTQSSYISGFNQYSDNIIGHTGPFNSGLTIPRGATHMIINLSFTELEDIELYDNTSRFASIEDALSGAEDKIETIDVINESDKVVSIQGGVPVVTDSSDKWGYGIIPVTGIKHIITFAGSGAFGVKIPAIIFLRKNIISSSSYIDGSEEYGTIDTTESVIKKYDEDIVIPAGANYIAINCFKDLVDNTTTITKDGFFKSAALDERITTLEQEISPQPQKKTLVVRKQPGSGEYGTIASALAVADSNTTILIYSGVYEEYHLNLPKDIIIKGIGDVEIRGYLPPSTSVTTSLNYSTLECYNGATLENLKITAKNMRYPIHADFSKGNAEWVVKNCIFEHYGNEEINNYWASQPGGDTSNIVSACSAWGGGTKGGDYVYCINCKFISTGRAFSTHNNADNSYNLNGASHVILESCEMISKGIDRDGVLVDLLAPLFIQSLDCPVDGCDVVVSNCSINGYIVFQNSGGDGWSNKLKVFNCGKNKIAFSGYGSGPNLIRNGGQISTYESHYDKYPMISNYGYNFVNRGLSAITKGKAVKLTSDGGIALYDNTSDDVFGVAMQDISVGGTGDVWYDGYLSRIWLDGIRTTPINEGDNIYVDNTGSFSTSGTKIAFKAVDNQNVQLFN